MRGRCHDDKVDELSVLYNTDHLVLSLQTTTPCAFTQTYQHYSLNHFTQTSPELASTQHGPATSVELEKSNQAQKLAKK